MIEQFDVVVFGAGPAGLCAALQAARAGAKTALVEKNGICGGTLTFCGVNYPGIFAAWGRQIIAGIGWELLVKTWNECNEGMPENRIPYMHQKKVDKLVFAAFADEALVSAGVDIRFHTMPGKAERDEKSNLWNLTLCDKDGLYDICSKVVIDCTGDANVIHMAKLPCRMPEETQPGTLSMYFHNFDESKLDFDLLEQRFNQALSFWRIWAGQSVSTGDFSPDTEATATILSVTMVPTAPAGPKWKLMAESRSCGCSASSAAVRGWKMWSFISIPASAACGKPA